MSGDSRGSCAVSLAQTTQWRRVLRQALWVVSTAKNNLRRGGQVLVLEAADGEVRYLPVGTLTETA